MHILHEDILGAAHGGMRIDSFSRSNNIDRSYDSHLWSPTEDGRVVGPQGQWTWDPTINANQPPEAPDSISETGHLIERDGTAYRDPDIGAYGRVDAANREFMSPANEEARNYMSDAINFKLSPTEDGKMVGSNGRVYADPSINENQNVYTHQPGEFVPGVHENENAPNGYSSWPLMGSAGSGTSPGAGGPAGDSTSQPVGWGSNGVDEAGFTQAFGNGNDAPSSFSNDAQTNDGFGDANTQQGNGFQSSSADEQGFVDAFGGNNDSGNQGGDQQQSDSLPSGGYDESGFADAFPSE